MTRLATYKLVGKKSGARQVQIRFILTPPTEVTFVREKPIFSETGVFPALSLSLSFSPLKTGEIKGEIKTSFRFKNGHEM